MTGFAIRTKGLGKSHKLYAHPFDRVRELLSPSRKSYHHELWALKGVDLEIAHGTITGIVGENGAGKSTLLKLIAGKTSPTEGAFEARGRISAILELGTGFQMQLTGRQNALVNALFLGQHPWEASARVQEILDFAELGEYSDQPLSSYSSGMQARLAFSVLTTLDPEILVLDEALATGDAGFAEKCKTFLRSLCSAGRTTILVSHDLNYVRDTCDRVVWLDHGQIRADGQSRESVRAYLRFLGVNETETQEAPTPSSPPTAPTSPSSVPLPFSEPPPPPPPLPVRPQNVLLRIEAENKTLAEPFLLHVLQWIGPDDEILASHYIGYDETFEECLKAATVTGLPLESAKAGFGPAQDFRSQGLGFLRACRPDLGPSGAAYLALPVLKEPVPLPQKLRLAIGRNKTPTAPVFSIQANGRFVVLGSVPPADDPWERIEFDVSFAFGPQGKAAPPVPVSTPGLARKVAPT